MTSRLAVLALALVLVVTACGTDQGEDAPQATTDETPSDAADSADSADSAGTEGTADGETVDCASTASADHPDVVDAELAPAGDGLYEVSATLCSAYDTPERYADAWRVVTPEGEVLGIRELLHDHAGEQPFTRSLGSPVEVPDGFDTLVIEGRDLANGWGGETFEVSVPRG